jgi:nucleoside phosphorylase
MVAGRYCTARVAVVTILPLELAAMRDALALVEDPWGLGYLVDDSDTPRVIVTQAERTQVGAVGEVTRILEASHPEIVIETGIAGGIPGREEVRPGDVVVPDIVHFFNYVKLTPSGYERRFLPADQPSSNVRRRYARPVSRADAWRSRVTLKRPVFEEPRDQPPQMEPRVYLEGSMVATDELMGNPSADDQKRLVREFPDAVAVDMESMGVARAVHDYRSDVRYNPQFLIVRGISDLVLSEEKHDAELIKKAGDNKKQRSDWEVYAAQAAAVFTHEVIMRITRWPDSRDA